MKQTIVILLVVSVLLVGSFSVGLSSPDCPGDEDCFKTRTPTTSPTGSLTPTPSITPSLTATASPSPTATATATQTATPSPSPTASPTASPSPTPILHYIYLPLVKACPDGFPSDCGDYPWIVSK